jgi:hypothetical protein
MACLTRQIVIPFHLTHQQKPIPFESHQEVPVQSNTALLIIDVQLGMFEECVDTICRRAYSLGYDVTLAQDAHSTWDTEHLEASQIIDHHNQVLGGWFATLKEACGIGFDGAGEA